MTDSLGTLKEGEPHPSSQDAMKFVNFYLERNPSVVESLANASMKSNRLAEVCYETLRRVVNSEPVNDRYLLGLAWFLAALDWRQKNDKVD